MSLASALRRSPQPALAVAARRFASFTPKELEAYRGKIAADLTGRPADLDAKAKLLEFDAPTASYSAVTFPKAPKAGAPKEVLKAYTDCMVAEQAWLDEKLSAAKAHLATLLAAKMPVRLARGAPLPGPRAGSASAKGRGKRAMVRSAAAGCARARAARRQRRDSSRACSDRATLCRE
jgi:hypothetical protein